MGTKTAAKTVLPSWISTLPRLQQQAILMHLDAVFRACKSPLPNQTISAAFGDNEIKSFLELDKRANPPDSSIEESNRRYLKIILDSGSSLPLAALSGINLTHLSARQRKALFEKLDGSHYTEENLSNWSREPLYHADDLPPRTTLFFLDNVRDVRWAERIITRFLHPSMGLPPDRLNELLNFVNSVCSLKENPAAQQMFESRFHQVEPATSSVSPINSPELAITVALICAHAKQDCPTDIMRLAQTHTQMDLASLTIPDTRTELFAKFRKESGLEDFFTTPSQTNLLKLVNPKYLRIIGPLCSDAEAEQILEYIESDANTIPESNCARLRQHLTYERDTIIEQSLDIIDPTAISVNSAQSDLVFQHSANNPALLASLTVSELRKVVSISPDQVIFHPRANDGFSYWNYVLGSESPLSKHWGHTMFNLFGQHPQALRLAHAILAVKEGAKPLKPEHYQALLEYCRDLCAGDLSPFAKCLLRDFAPKSAPKN